MIKIIDLFHQLHLTDQAISQMFEERLGFSLTRYEILQTLLKLKIASQKQIQEVLQIDPAAITRHLKILEDKGYICRERNPNNQREVLVSLTDYGYDTLKEDCNARHRLIKHQMETILSVKEKETLNALLKKLVLGLENVQIEESDLSS